MVFCMHRGLPASTLTHSASEAPTPSSEASVLRREEKGEVGGWDPQAPFLQPLAEFANFKT